VSPVGYLIFSPGKRGRGEKGRTAATIDRKGRGEQQIDRKTRLGDKVVCSLFDLYLSGQGGAWEKKKKNPDVSVHWSRALPQGKKYGSMAFGQVRGPYSLRRTIIPLLPRSEDGREGEERREDPDHTTCADVEGKRKPDALRLGLYVTIAL